MVPGRLLVAVVFVVALTACIPARGDKSYQNFVKAAENAPSDGYTMYWLGREFEAGGVTFEGPSVDDFGQEVELGGVLMSYTADGSQSFDLGLTVETQPAWVDAKSRGIFRIPGNAVRRDVSVAGHPAESVVFPANPGLSGIQGIQVHVNVGDTSILATVSTFVPAGGGPDPNPLKDEETLLRVLDQLRPYPD
jgi:hypothetical protein